MIDHKHMSIYIMYTHVYTTEEQRQKGLLLVGVVSKCFDSVSVLSQWLQDTVSLLLLASRKPIGHFKHKKIFFFYGKGSHVNQAALKLAVQ